MTIQPTDPLGRMYAEWTEEFIANPDMSLRLMRWLFEDWQRVTTEPSDVTYETTELGGVPGILVTPLTADAGQVLVFLHGGGFALGSSASHRKLAGHVAKACGTHAFVADFRRAPEHPFPRSSTTRPRCSTRWSTLASTRPTSRSSGTAPAPASPSPPRCACCVTAGAPRDSS